LLIILFKSFEPKTWARSLAANRMIPPMPRPRFKFMRHYQLRTRLTVAFLFLAGLIGICGASGLFFVQGIGATVSIFSDVTSPLLGQTVGLVDNAQRMRAAFLAAVNADHTDMNHAHADRPGGARGIDRAAAPRQCRHAAGETG
jgi:hypothetical protein